MITYNGIQLRNLEEQVLKNKQDIAKHYQATQLPANLAGITVIGKIDDRSELDGVIGENFGDAYVQVIGEDTTLWIWTRSNPDAGEDTDYWLNIPFTTVGEQGPEGPEGPKGDTGERGNRWYSMDHAPGDEIPSDAIEYDIWFNYTTGNIWHLHNINGQLRWRQEGSIKGAPGDVGPIGPVGPKGAQGDQGLTGPRGPAGSSVQIVGIVDSISQLSGVSPASTNDAYLVGLEGDYSIYLYSTVSSQWYNAGPFNAGTQVIDAGVLVKTWDADTKLDKVTTTGSNKVYGINSSGVQRTYIIRVDPQPTNASYKNQIVQYDITGNENVNNGLIRIAETPLEDYHTASKKYVDTRNRYYRTSGMVDLGNGVTAFLSLVSNEQINTWDDFLTETSLEWIPVTGYTSEGYVDDGVLPVAIKYMGLSDYSIPELQVMYNTGSDEILDASAARTYEWTSRII